MKNIINSVKALALVIVAVICFTPNANAQVIPNAYFNIDWQLNGTVSTKYADNFSGWGANFEGGYLVTPNIGVGAFISYSSNNKYIGRQTLNLNENEAITSDQQHHIFQMPFGIAGRYVFSRESNVQPYFGLRLGTEYSQITSQMNVFEFKENKWGFYASPEIGANIYLGPQQQAGIHVAAYYSIASNKTKILTYDIDNINNFGFRIGLAF